MDLTAFPLTIEVPRPFIVACTVSLAVHAGVAGWYRLGAETEAVQLPHPTLQVKVRSLHERASIPPATMRVQAASRSAPPVREQQRITTPSAVALVAESRSAEKPAAPGTVGEPEAKEGGEDTESTKNTPDIPLPSRATEKAADSGPRYTPPSSDSAALNNPKPAYPRIALRRGIEGLVLLHVDVDERGYPVDIQIRKSAGFKPLDIAALRAVRRWRFLPAQRNGVAVRASIEVPVRFRIDRTGRSGA